jgi:predicted 3-demethylubiquinone-9 3-methyltransferase (glyoxalase superfamily)
MRKITPFLWFNDNAEEAVNFYASVFEKVEIRNVARYSDAGPGTKGKVMTIAFSLNGQDFVALNGGPVYSFTPAVSFFVDCKTQEEVDQLWNKLTADGGQEVQCGWLTDKFGLSWQIVPSVLPELMSGDPARAKRVAEAMFTMKKLDIAKLRAAAAAA